jgi:hypothetical protein
MYINTGNVSETDIRLSISLTEPAFLAALKQTVVSWVEHGMKNSGLPFGSHAVRKILSHVLVTIKNYNIIAHLHDTNHFTLLFSVYFH